MAVAAFDTLTVSKDLQQAGIQAKHAEAIALAIKQSQGDLATKQDITLLRSDIAQLMSELKADIAWMKWVLGVNLALSVGIFATVISGYVALMPSP